MADTKKEFKLDAGLEQLVGYTAVTKDLMERAEEDGVNTNLITEASGVYNKLREKGLSNMNTNTFGSVTPYDFLRFMASGNQGIKERLEGRLDDKLLAMLRDFI